MVNEMFSMVMEMAPVSKGWNRVVCFIDSAI